MIRGKGRKWSFREWREGQFIGRSPGGILGRGEFSRVSAATADPRLGFYDLREKECCGGGFENAGCNCQPSNKTFNAFVSNKRIVHRVLHWAVSCGHYSGTGRCGTLIGRAMHHGRSAIQHFPHQSIHRQRFPSLQRTTLYPCYVKSSRVKRYEARVSYSWPSNNSRLFSIKIFRGEDSRFSKKMDNTFYG